MLLTFLPHKNKSKPSTKGMNTGAHYKWCQNTESNKERIWNPDTESDRGMPIVIWDSSKYLTQRCMLLTGAVKLKSFLIF